MSDFFSLIWNYENLKYVIIISSVILLPIMVAVFTSMVQFLLVIPIDEATSPRDHYLMVVLCFFMCILFSTMRLASLVLLAMLIYVIPWIGIPVLLWLLSVIEYGPFDENNIVYYNYFNYRRQLKKTHVKLALADDVDTVEYPVFFNSLIFSLFGPMIDKTFIGDSREVRQFMYSISQVYKGSYLIKKGMEHKLGK